MQLSPSAKTISRAVTALALLMVFFVGVSACPQRARAASAPDYSDPARWLSRDTTGTSPVDVFYLYPTSYVATGTQPIICAIDDPGMLAGAAVDFLRQASAFEPVGNIYAPYYRQADAGMRAKMPQSEQDQVVAGAPTQDGISAFDYYLKHYNKGKPYILVSHSLGSNVMANLLAQYMSGNPAAYKRMVAAYVVGYSITPSYLSANPHLKFATGANDTGVIVSWNTEGPVLAAPNPVTLPGGLAINPISWSRTEETATADQNLGSELLEPTGTPVGMPILNPDGSMKRYLGVADARVDLARGVVVCSSVPERVVSMFTGSFPEGVYHPFDYPFYYFDVQVNAQNRVAHFTAPTALSLPTVSRGPRHRKPATFTSYLTPASAASVGTAKVSFYHRSTKRVWKKVGSTWKWVRVSYWRPQVTKVMARSTSGRLTLGYKLPYAGSWKMVVNYSGAKGYAHAHSAEKVFSVK